MKKIFVIFLLIPFYLHADPGFFLQGRSGVLIKVDPASAYQPNHPEKKGPTLDEIPLEISAEELEDKYLTRIKNIKLRVFVKNAYQLDETNNLYRFKDDWLLDRVDYDLIRRVPFNHVKREQRNLLFKYYKLDYKTRYYHFKADLDEGMKKEISNQLALLILRVIFLEINEKNEIRTGLDRFGMPMPHKFPRVFEAKTKGNFDIHFVWGYRFENNVTLGFSINLTNFVMPSLEIMVKYNFVIEGAFLEPYVGGLVYGGFLDGFPFGISALGGVDFFPAYGTAHHKNLFVSTEMRVGPAFYAQMYFDTGDNAEGIWKKFSILAEGGFYVMSGYRWDHHY